MVMSVPRLLRRVYDYTRLAPRSPRSWRTAGCGGEPIALGLSPRRDNSGAMWWLARAAAGHPAVVRRPYLGKIFATSKRGSVRQDGRRLVGETMDNRGQRAYVLTLTAPNSTSGVRKPRRISAQTRVIPPWPHGLYAVGKQGLREVSELCYHKAHYAAQQIAALPGYACGQKHILPMSSPCIARHRRRRSTSTCSTTISCAMTGPGLPRMENDLLIAVTERTHAKKSTYW